MTGGKSKTMKTKFSANLVAAVAAAVLTLGVGAVFTSCDSGGGGGPSGSSTVQGNVSSFTTGTALFLPAPKARGFERLLAGVGDLLVPGASQDMNNLPPVAGKSTLYTTASGHPLNPGDGQLLVQILKTL